MSIGFRTFRALFQRKGDVSERDWAFIELRNLLDDLEARFESLDGSNVEEKRAEEHRKNQKKIRELEKEIEGLRSQAVDLRVKHAELACNYGLLLLELDKLKEEKCESVQDNKE